MNMDKCKRCGERVEAGCYCDTCIEAMGRAHDPAVAALGPWGRLCHWFGYNLVCFQSLYYDHAYRWWDPGRGLTPADRVWLALAPAIPPPARLDRSLDRLGCWFADDHRYRLFPSPFAKRAARKRVAW
jgi:hypothetical protein